MKSILNIRSGIIIITLISIIFVFKKYDGIHYRLFGYQIPIEKSLITVEELNNINLIPYIFKTPIFSDRDYIEAQNLELFRNSTLIQFPRHFTKDIRIRSHKESVVYRLLSIKNENRIYDDWTSLGPLAMVKGAGSVHDVAIMEKYLPGIYTFYNRGPKTSSPIFIISNDSLGLGPDILTTEVSN
jgi:hypothetical protein